MKLYELKKMLEKQIIPRSYIRISKRSMKDMEGVRQGEGHLDLNIATYETSTQKFDIEHFVHVGPLFCMRVLLIAARGFFELCLIGKFPQRTRNISSVEFERRVWFRLEMSAFCIRIVSAFKRRVSLKSKVVSVTPFDEETRATTWGERVAARSQQDRFRPCGPHPSE